MEDLMAGLDASVFDNVLLSPSQPAKSPQKTSKSPTKSPSRHRAVLSPTKRLLNQRREASPRKPIATTVELLKPLSVKEEPASALQIPAEVKVEPSSPKKEIEIVDELEFDFDLGDLFAIDDSRDAASKVTVDP